MSVVAAGVHGAGNFAGKTQHSRHMIRGRRFRHQHTVDVKTKHRHRPRTSRREFGYRTGVVTETIQKRLRHAVRQRTSFRFCYEFRITSQYCARLNGFDPGLDVIAVLFKTRHNPIGRFKFSPPLLRASMDGTP